MKSLILPIPTQRCKSLARGRLPTTVCFGLICVVLWTVSSVYAAPLQVPQTSTPDGEEPASLVRLVGLRVSPENPGNESLCELTVLVENASESPVFSLVFEVTVGGEKQSVYDKQVYMVPIPSRAAEGEQSSTSPTELRLFNFWTSDSRREAPANGQLEVTVKLVEAQWLERTESKAEDGSPLETWAPKGEVPGLPSTVSTTIKLGS